MRKLTAALAFLIFYSFSSSAQSYVTTVTYNKTQQPGLLIELPYNEDISQDFIIANLKKTGYDAETKGSLFWKNNKINGFYIFKGVRLEGASEAVDLYFKVEEKSRKHKDESIVYMLISKGGETFVPSTEEGLYNAA